MTYAKVPFPTIDVSKPRGSYKVSTVDDHERETRRWLKQCMQALSGYPEIDTVGVMGWTTASRPRRSPNGNYLLGYNTTTQALELVAEDGSIANITKAVSLVAHPIGSIYETTDASFDPNTAWGGVWELMDDGRFLLSTSSTHGAGSIGGEEEHVLSIPELASHRHLHTHQHSHTKGTLVIPNVVNDSSSEGVVSGFSWITDGTPVGQYEGMDGHTDYDDTQGGSYVGGGQAHNNMPPYLVVYRWHRLS